MAIYNLGSINIDNFYRLPHLVSAGETLSAIEYRIALGGKGANQSVALAKAGAEVFHIGACGKKDVLFLDEMSETGVNIENIALIETVSGHAIVMVDAKTGENQIVLSGAANYKISEDQITCALIKAKENDWALAQNETCLVNEFLSSAKKKGLKICYSAAPFVAEQTASLLYLTDLLVVNEVEADALLKYTNKELHALGVPNLVITLGSKGAQYIGVEGDFFVSPFNVNAIDTTGAGDTFLGYLLASLSQGLTMMQAMDYGSAAASLQITKQGALRAVPTMEEVKHFLKQNG